MKAQISQAADKNLSGKDQRPGTLYGRPAREWLQFWNLSGKSNRFLETELNPRKAKVRNPDG